MDPRAGEARGTEEIALDLVLGNRFNLERNFLKRVKLHFLPRTSALLMVSLLVAAAPLPAVWGQSKPVYLGSLTGIGAPAAPQPLRLAATNNLLYIGTSLGMYVYEVSTPSLPQEVGYLAPNPISGGIMRILLQGNRAYLASVGLRIVDVSDPAQPVELSYVDDSNGGTNGLATDLAVSGSYVFVANGADGLRVYDAANAYAPTSIGHWPNVASVFGSYPQGIALSGSYAYLANYGDGLRIFDVSNPANPVNVRDIPDAKASRVVIRGDILYLISDRLTIFDISFPAKPVKLAETMDPPDPVALGVDGNYLYVACSGYSFYGPYMYDVSSPANALRLSPSSTYYNEYPVRDMAMSSQVAYLAMQFGVNIYNLGTPIAPTLSIAKPDSRTVRLSWQAPSFEFKLLETTDPVAGQWRTITNAVVQTLSGRNQITLPFQTDNRFYRLSSGQ